MPEDQIRIIREIVREQVREAIQAERQRTIQAFRNASAEFVNRFGTVEFDFETSVGRIADAIEEES